MINVSGGSIGISRCVSCSPVWSSFEYTQKDVFKYNPSLAAHSFDKSSRQDGSFTFAVDSAFRPYSMHLETYQRSRWSKFYYDYEDWESKNKWKTLYVAYMLVIYLNDDFTLKNAFIEFADLNDVMFEVYPNNDIDIEKMHFSR